MRSHDPPLDVEIGVRWIRLSEPEAEFGLWDEIDPAERFGGDLRRLSRTRDTREEHRINVDTREMSLDRITDLLSP